MVQMDRQSHKRKVSVTTIIWRKQIVMYNLNVKSVVVLNKSIGNEKTESILKINYHKKSRDPITTITNIIKVLLRKQNGSNDKIYSSYLSFLDYLYSYSHIHT